MIEGCGLLLLLLDRTGGGHLWLDDDGILSLTASVCAGWFLLRSSRWWGQHLSCLPREMASAGVWRSSNRKRSKSTMKHDAVCDTHSLVKATGHNQHALWIVMWWQSWRAKSRPNLVNGRLWANQLLLSATDRMKNCHSAKYQRKQNPHIFVFEIWSNWDEIICCTHFTIK